MLPFDPESLQITVDAIDPGKVIQTQPADEDAPDVDTDPVEGDGGSDPTAVSDIEGDKP